jgi:DNA polymerase-3 subunit epsilon/ATP-dependent DNA helicase DinG
LTQTYVAIDLETTGLDIGRDSIIEVGAIRFTLEGEVDTFQALVRPPRDIPLAVERLTGISQADLADAPPIEIVASDIEDYIGGSVLVGHNICGFDVPVLDAHNIRRPILLYDTQQLAELLLPSAPGFGLADLSGHFGVALDSHHRALSDAEAARGVFLALVEHALQLPAEVLSRVGDWLTPTQYPWRNFFRDVWDLRGQRRLPPVPTAASVEESPTPLRPSRSGRVNVPPATAAALLGQAAARPDVIGGFEQRPQQVAMLEAVAEAMNREEHLIVEAGTGTGKSLGYLLPAACQTVANDSRVVVSTSTINLQEQLAGKDVPAVQALMGEDAPRACRLKGRRNYLCLKRFHSLEGGHPGSDEEALLASRILIWLESTPTGDRGEIRLSPGEERIWARLSAEGADCNSDTSPFYVDGSCFLLRARRRAESSHIVVVNHSLLLADAAIGGQVLPWFDHLVIDEAHHLEDEASRQFGFACTQADLLAVPDRASELVRDLLKLTRDRPLPAPGNQEIASAASVLREGVKPVREHLDVFYRTFGGFLAGQAGAEEKLHVTRGTRSQPGWSGVEVAWDNVSAALKSLAGTLARLLDALNDIAIGAGPPGLDFLAASAQSCLDDALQMMAGITSALERHDPDRIVWIERDRGDGGIVISWVPLDVSSRLREALYTEGRSVTLTGATLQGGDGFSYIQRRLGLDDAETLAVGSPFDYRRQALLAIAQDMPDPQSPAFVDALAPALQDIILASRGRALVLFTSYGMLHPVASRVSPALEEAGITALAQGADGSARQLVRALQSDPATAIFGTASFWEGIDVPGDNLSLLVITRLPFPVPTDPVHAARAEQYEDAFANYTLPQAVIRLKQGFGRLIRSSTDRGVAVVLDPRIATRDYGRVFLESLPPCPVRSLPIRDIPAAVETFLASPVT